MLSEVVGDRKPDLEWWARQGAFDARNLRPFQPPDYSPLRRVFGYSKRALREAGKAYERGFMDEHKRLAKERLRKTQEATCQQSEGVSKKPA